MHAYFIFKLYNYPSDLINKQLALVESYFMQPFYLLCHNYVHTGDTGLRRPVGEDGIKGPKGDQGDT